MTGKPHRYSIHDYFGYQNEMKETYKLIAKVGFDGVMLGWCDFPSNPEYTKRINVRYARESGLEVENLHAPFSGCNAIWLDSGRGDEYLHAVMSTVTDCAAFEVGAAIVHLSSGDEPPQTSDTGMERLKRLVDYAERLNVDIAFENLRRLEPLRRVFAEIDSERVKFCFDSGHHNWRTSGIDVLGEFGSRLRVLHLHDNDKSADQHRLPFDGNINWPECMKKIAGTGYDGSISLEVVNAGYESLTAEEFLAQAYDRAKKLAELMDKAE